MTDGNVSRRLTRYFIDYEAYHQTLGNKLTHYVGIPLVVLSMAGLLSMVQVAGSTGLGGIDLGLILVSLLGAWVIFLDWRVGMPFFAAFFGFYVASRFIPVEYHLAMFVIGWMFQFAGHIMFEHRRPALFNNISHMIIGPVWIFAQLLGFYRVKKPIKKIQQDAGKSVEQTG